MVNHSTLAVWLQRTDSNGHLMKEWLTRSGDGTDLTELYCKVCVTPISTKGKGFQAVSQHYGRDKHKLNAQAKLNPLQLTLAGRSTESQEIRQSDVNQGTAAEETGKRENSSLALSFSKIETHLKSELQWAMKCVQAGFSNNSCENIVPLFQSMFGDGVPPDMSLGRTKVGYLMTDALGPYFHNEMLDDAHSSSSYSFCFDETVNNKKVKELQCGIKFWSNVNDQVEYHHLETIFIGSAKGVIVKGHIMGVLDRANLSLSKFLMASCDGPNVNKTILRLVNEEVKKVRVKGLLDAGSCNLHVMHNSFLAGLEVFGDEVSVFVAHVYDYFDGFPSRGEEYCESQVLKKVPLHSFIRHVSSRWLTLGDAAERDLEQLPALTHYFLSIIPKSTSESHKKIRETQRYLHIRTALQDPTFPAQITFVIQCARLFELFSKTFQKSEPMIHKLYEELHSLYVMLLGRFCKPELVSTSRNCLKEDFIRNKDNLLPIKKVDCGEKTETLLAKCKEVDVLKFKLEAQKHYQAAASYLLKKSVLGKWPDGKHMKCLQPGAIKDPGSPRSAVLVYRMLPLDLGINEDVLKDEWRLLMLENLPNYDPGVRVDHYWKKIFAISGPDGLSKYPNITNMVKAALIIGHGSADIERGFSESSNQLRPNQARMEERLLNAKLWIRDGLKRYHGRPDLVPITKKLLTAAVHAHRNYEEYLLRQREEAAAAARREAEETEERRQREAREARQEKERQSLEALQVKLAESQNAEREQSKAAAQLLDEASKKLNAAVKAGDMVAVKVAAGMLTGAKAMRDQAETLQKNSEPLQKQVKKRTSSLLEAFFKNHAKKKKGETDENPDDPERI